MKKIVIDEFKSDDNTLTDSTLIDEDTQTFSVEPRESDISIESADFDDDTAELIYDDLTEFCYEHDFVTFNSNKEKVKQDFKQSFTDYNHQNDVDNTEEFYVESDQINQLSQNFTHDIQRSVFDSSDIDYEKLKTSFVNRNTLLAMIISIAVLALLLLIYSILINPNITFKELYNYKINQQDFIAYKQRSVIYNSPPSENLDKSVTEIVVYLKKNYEAHTGKQPTWKEQKSSSTLLLKDANCSFVFNLNPDTTKPKSLVVIFKYEASDEFTEVSNSVALKSAKHVEDIIISIISSIDLDSFYTASANFNEIDNNVISINGYDYNYFKFPQSKILILELVKK